MKSEAPIQKNRQRQSWQGRFVGLLCHLNSKQKDESKYEANSLQLS